MRYTGTVLLAVLTAVGCGDDGLNSVTGPTPGSSAAPDMHDQIMLPPVQNDAAGSISNFPPVRQLLPGTNFRRMSATPNPVVAGPGNTVTVTSGVPQDHQPFAAHGGATRSKAWRIMYTRTGGTETERTWTETEIATNCENSDLGTCSFTVPVDACQPEDVPFPDFPDFVIPAKCRAVKALLYTKASTGRFTAHRYEVCIHVRHPDDNSIVSTGNCGFARR